MRTIQDTFGTERSTAEAIPSPNVLVTWPKLRKLSLDCFDSSPRALISLVIRHSSTLQDLRLRAIWLDDTEDTGPTEKHTWREILSVIGASTSLANVNLSGHMRNIQHEDDVWDFDDGEFAHAVANWIISGGKCPLVEERRSRASNNTTCAVKACKALTD
ncbi:hypothetical protein SVAN01_10597 [Stagonosporopsis vannaccii]|nr:hypothetical protein SVAN01_10597 [Stagonosporopsis vannaccii]